MLPSIFLRRNTLINRRLSIGIVFYLLLCLTMGGFHDCACNAGQGNQAHHVVYESNDDAQLGISDNDLCRDSEMCQICQWLKDPSSAAPSVLWKTYFVFKDNCLVSFSTSVFPFLPICKFTIRPPPPIS